MTYNYTKALMFSPAGMVKSFTGSFTKITAIPEPGDLVGIDGASENNSGSKIDMISFGHIAHPESATTASGAITSSFFLPYGTSIEAPMFRITATGTGSLLIYTGKTPY